MDATQLKGCFAGFTMIAAGLFIVVYDCSERPKDSFDICPRFQARGRNPSRTSKKMRFIDFQ